MDAEFERLGRILDEALEFGGASAAAVAACRRDTRFRSAPNRQRRIM